MGRVFIVVPESLEADAAGRATARPSFAYRQVLDRVRQLAAAGDRVYLAPANSFGGTATEERAAWDYLRQASPAFEVLCPGVNLGPYAPDGAYVDTWGNAERLRPLLKPGDATFELVTTHLHARRARWCFERAGFGISQVHAVAYALEPGRVMRRNFYYRHPGIHRLYEILALARDRLRHR